MEGAAQLKETLIALGIFAGGFASGWFARGLVYVRGNSTRQIVGLVIVLVWAATTMADAVIPSYSAPWQVHLLVGGVTGWLFGFNPFKGRQNGGTKKEG